MWQEYPTKEVSDTETISSVEEPESGGGTLFIGSTEALLGAFFFLACLLFDTRPLIWLAYFFIAMYNKHI